MLIIPMGAACLADLILLELINPTTTKNINETAHCAIFSTPCPLSYAQTRVFSSVPCSETPSTCGLISETKNYKIQTTDKNCQHQNPILPDGKPIKQAVSNILCIYSKFMHKTQTINRD
jgi:hypothetical protein